MRGTNSDDRRIQQEPPEGVHLLGWHWEFLPSFLAKLVPGVDLVPFWTMTVVEAVAGQFFPEQV